ncbi:hypothetical protein PVL30_000012 [Lodderomyces elongisporus]|uniref:uncharacterized protein n=1 Tax=Lodderomyces elongisporus TaxID=36914 RepID=UPI0029257EA9|nr:uncharacterized protein PVL30_000012 [Lodderomyces elongisporus]WLF76311.1 hypothetical protein PVL30_000012 [Lodderomyces elongisporus]
MSYKNPFLNSKLSQSRTANNDQSNKKQNGNTSFAKGFVPQTSPASVSSSFINGRVNNSITSSRNDTSYTRIFRQSHREMSSGVNPSTPNADEVINRINKLQNRYRSLISHQEQEMTALREKHQMERKAQLQKDKMRKVTFEGEIVNLGRLLQQQQQVETEGSNEIGKEKQEQEQVEYEDDESDESDEDEQEEEVAEEEYSDNVKQEESNQSAEDSDIEIISISDSDSEEEDQPESVQSKIEKTDEVNPPYNHVNSTYTKSYQHDDENEHECESEDEDDDEVVDLDMDEYEDEEPEEEEEDEMDEEDEDEGEDEMDEEEDEMDEEDEEEGEDEEDEEDEEDGDDEQERNSAINPYDGLGPNNSNLFAQNLASYAIGAHNTEHENLNQAASFYNPSANLFESNLYQYSPNEQHTGCDSKPASSQELQELIKDPSAGDYDKLNQNFNQTVRKQDELRYQSMHDPYANHGEQLKLRYSEQPAWNLQYRSEYPIQPLHEYDDDDNIGKDVDEEVDEDEDEIEEIGEEDSGTRSESEIEIEETSREQENASDTNKFTTQSQSHHDTGNATGGNNDAEGEALNKVEYTTKPEQPVKFENSEHFQPSTSEIEVKYPVPLFFDQKNETTHNNSNYIDSQEEDYADSEKEEEDEDEDQEANKAEGVYNSHLVSTFPESTSKISRRFHDSNQQSGYMADSEFTDNPTSFKHTFKEDEQEGGEQGGIKLGDKEKVEPLEEMQDGNNFGANFAPLPEAFYAHELNKPLKPRDRDDNHSDASLADESQFESAKSDYYNLPVIKDFISFTQTLPQTTEIKMDESELKQNDSYSDSTSTPQSESELPPAPIFRSITPEEPVTTLKKLKEAEKKYNIKIEAVDDLERSLGISWDENDEEHKTKNETEGKQTEEKQTEGKQTLNFFEILSAHEQIVKPILEPIDSDSNIEQEMESDQDTSLMISENQSSELEDESRVEVEAIPAPELLDVEVNGYDKEDIEGDSDSFDKHDNDVIDVVDESDYDTMTLDSLASDDNQNRDADITMENEDSKVFKPETDDNETTENIESDASTNSDVTIQAFETSQNDSRSLSESIADSNKQDILKSSTPVPIDTSKVCNDDNSSIEKDNKNGIDIDIDNIDDHSMNQVYPTISEDVQKDFGNSKLNEATESEEPNLVTDIEVAETNEDAESAAEEPFNFELENSNLKVLSQSISAPVLDPLSEEENNSSSSCNSSIMSEDSHLDVVNSESKEPEQAAIQTTDESGSDDRMAIDVLNVSEDHTEPPLEMETIQRAESKDSVKPKVEGSASKEEFSNEIDNKIDNEIAVSNQTSASVDEINKNDPKVENALALPESYEQFDKATNDIVEKSFEGIASKYEANFEESELPVEHALPALICEDGLKYAEGKPGEQIESDKQISVEEDKQEEQKQEEQEQEDTNTENMEKDNDLFEEVDQEKLEPSVNDVASKGEVDFKKESKLVKPIYNAFTHVSNISQSTRDYLYHGKNYVASTYQSVGTQYASSKKLMSKMWQSIPSIELQISKETPVVEIEYKRPSRRRRRNRKHAHLLLKKALYNFEAPETQAALQIITQTHLNSDGNDEKKHLKSSDSESSSVENDTKSVKDGSEVALTKPGFEMENIELSSIKQEPKSTRLARKSLPSQSVQKTTNVVGSPSKKTPHARLSTSSGHHNQQQQQHHHRRNLYGLLASDIEPVEPIRRLRNGHVYGLDSQSPAPVSSPASPSLSHQSSRRSSSQQEEQLQVDHPASRTRSKSPLKRTLQELAGPIEQNRHKKRKASDTASPALTSANEEERGRSRER